MKTQLQARLAPDVAALVLAKFNHGELTASEACARLGVGRTRLYDLRTQWLQQGADFRLRGAGGDMTGGWPAEADGIAERLLRLSTREGAEPINYAIIADCIQCETGLKMDRTTVMRHCRAKWPMLCQAPKRPRPIKRWAMERAGALLQIDSTPVHLFGGEDEWQHLVAVEDDATREILALRLAESDSVFVEMDVLREAVGVHGVPAVIYTDGFSIFGHEGADIVTAYGRMCRALSVTHRIAPTPQAKANFKVLGKKLGPRMKAAAAAIAALPAADIARLQAGNGVVLHLDGPGEEITLLPEDVLVQRSENAGLTVANDGDLSVALDPALTPELVAEGIAREFVSHVQSLRKEADLDVADRIRVSVSTDAEAAAALRAHAEFIRGETLALELSIQAGGSGGAAPRSLADLNGHPAAIAIEKA